MFHCSHIGFVQKIIDVGVALPDSGIKCTAAFVVAVCIPYFIQYVHSLHGVYTCVQSNLL